MAIARVVSFEGVSAERMTQMQSEMQGGPPPEIPATEILVLHDPDGGKAVVVLFFENEDDYTRGNETLNAMPAGDTPGQRTSVARYDVAMRMKA